MHLPSLLRGWSQPQKAIGETMFLAVSWRGEAAETWLAGRPAGQISEFGMAGDGERGREGYESGECEVESRKRRVLQVDSGTKRCSELKLFECSIAVRAESEPASWKRRL